MNLTSGISKLEMLHTFSLIARVLFCCCALTWASVGNYLVTKLEKHLFTYKLVIKLLLILMRYLVLIPARRVN